MMYTARDNIERLALRIPGEMQMGAKDVLRGRTSRRYCLVAWSPPCPFFLLLL